MGKRLRVKRCRLISPSPDEQGQVNNNFVMTIRNSVMHYRRAPQDETADATLILSKALFVDILVGEAGLTDLIGSDELSVDGSVLRLVKFFSLLGEPNDAFNIVLP